MSLALKLILIISLLVNIAAVWGFFHYINYGGSPLGELKRKLTGSSKQAAPRLSFLEENEQLIKERANRISNRWVVFFGASITRRWDLEKAFPEFKMINRGVGGQLAPDMLARFKRDVLDIQPDAVIIKFCSINIRPQMRLSVLQDAVMMMTEMAQTHNVRPILSTIIPAGKAEAHIGDFSVVDTLKTFNVWVRQYAAQKNLPLIDFAKAIEDDEGFLPRDCSVDPVHVNDKGYAILAETAHPVLRQVFGE